MKQMLYQRKKYVLAIFTAILFMGGTAMGQATGDFRSAATGNWNAIATWERFNGATWVAAAAFPTNADGAITIRNLHIVTITAAVSIDQTTIDLGGQITVNAAQTLTIAAGAGTDITVNGTVQNSGTMTMTGTATFNSGGVYRHNQTGGALPINTTWNANSTLEFSSGGTTTLTNMPDQTLGRLVVLKNAVSNNNTTVSLAGAGGNIDFTIANGTGTDLLVQEGCSLTLAATIDNFDLLAGASADISGTFTTNSSNDFTLQAGATVVVNGTFNCNTPDYISTAANTVTTVNGTFVNAGTITGATAAKYIVTATGTYQHAQNGGTIPTSTWSPGSTANITGIVGTAPTGLNQTFRNLTWNCTGQTADVALENTIVGILENFTIISTGTGGTAGTIRLANTNTDRTLTVGGNFVHTGGEFRVDNGNGGSTLNVTGNLNISGTALFIIASGGGPAIAAITGNVNITGGTLDLSDNNGGTGNLNLLGNFSHTAGTLTESANGSGNVNFNGTTPQTFTSGGTVTAGALVNYTVSTGATLQMAAEATVVNGAAFTVSGTGAGGTLGIRSADGITTAGTALGNIRTTARTYNLGGNYLYNGTAAQNIGTGLPAGLTGDLIIDNPTTVTLNVAKTIGANGLINLTSGVFNAGTNLTMTSTGLITRAGGVLLGTIGGGDYDVTYTGASKVAGLELQGGFTPTPRIRNFTVNLNAGASVTFTQGIGMKGVLTLTQGFLNTSLAAGFALTSTATCPGGGSTASFVNGPIARDGIAAFTYPVGAGGIYLPVAVSGTAGAIGSVLPATSLIVVTPYRDNAKKIIGTALTAPLLSTSACIYWDILRLSGGLTNIYVWLGIDEVDVCGTPPFVNTDLRVAHWEGAPAASWTSYGSSGVVTQNGANFIGSALPIQAFSPFTVGSVTGALPVELTNFTAAKNGNAVNLKWSTASEQNNAYFNVERSADGVSFSTIGKVNGAGNSSSTLNYSFTDNSPLAGKNFYRLRQVDFDGEFDLSAIVSVNMSVNSSISLYPNPVTNTALLWYPKAIKGAAYRLVAMDGRIMKSGILQENSTQMNLNLGGLQSGSYVLIINNNGEQYQQRIQKQ